MQRKDIVLLKKISSEIDIANDIMGEIPFDEFNANEEKKRAIAMTVINIGELVKNLSSEFRLEYNQIPWKAIAGFRDIAAHKYRSLFMDDVYNTVKIDFPDLKKNIRSILSENQN